MKSRTVSILRAALLTVILLSLPWAVDAQTITFLHRFGTIPNDGASPESALTLVGSNTLFGTTDGGGANGKGIIFAVDTDGSGYTNLHQFGDSADDGTVPFAALTLLGPTLYGTTYLGGTNNLGTVYAINTNGTGYVVLHEFGAGADGQQPESSLTVVGTTLYGTTHAGGAHGGGTVFTIETNATSYVIIHHFGVSPTDSANPIAGLTLVGSMLYGTTDGGGTNNQGTVYTMDTAGSNYSILHQFGSSLIDGTYPAGGLTLVGDTLYGTTFQARTNENGVVFAINTNGTGYVVLHQFGAPGDGSSPQALLTLVGSNTLYDTTQDGGVNSCNCGILFALNTDGSSYTNLHSWGADASDGQYGAGSHSTAVILVGPALYGTTRLDGTIGDGTVFKFALDICTFVSAPTNAAFNDSGGSNNVSVTASGTDCVWSATSGDSFIQITSGNSGTGNGTVDYSVTANGSSNSRTGTLTVAGQTLTVIQAGSTNLMATKIISLTGNLAFGNVTTGAMATTSLTISNGGNTNLTISSISYPTIEFSGAFSGTVAAGGSQNVTVTFAPLTVGIFSGTVTVNSDATGGTSTTTASGMGVATVSSPIATPTITPDGGVSNDFVKVTLKCTTPKAVIYYTTDGSQPTTESPKYKSAITLTNSATINAVAYAGTHGPSATATASFVISRPSITTAARLPDATASTEYSTTLAATGGTAPYKWKLFGTKLPTGLKLASTGIISGTAKTAGIANFTVELTDAKKGIAKQSFTLTVNQ